MGKQKLKRKPRKEKPVQLTKFDRLEISELGLVERLELFEWAIEDHAKKGLIGSKEYKYLMQEISRMIAESMEI
jgi:hypothetical protein